MERKSNGSKSDGATKRQRDRATEQRSNRAKERQIDRATERRSNQKKDFAKIKLLAKNPRH